MVVYLYILLLIEFINSLYFYKIFDKVKMNNKKRILFTVVSIFSCIFCCVIFLLSDGIFYVAFALYVLRMIGIIVIKNKIIKPLYLTTILFLLEASLYIFIVTLIDKTEYNENISLMFDYKLIITTSIFVVLETYLIYIIYKLSNSRTRIKIKDLLFFIIPTGLLYALDIYLLYLCLLNQNDIFIMLFILFSFFTVLVSVLLVNDVFLVGQRNYIENENELLQLKNDMILSTEKRNKEIFGLWKKSIHDYKHNIIALKQWSKNGELNKISDFLNEEYKLIDNKLVDYNTGNDTLNSILSYKHMIAEKRNIKFFANVMVDNKITIDDKDLVCLMGNLLDNAIESAELTDNAFVNIVINIKQDILLIKINNSYIAKSKNKNRKDEYLHGLGVKSIKEIVKKYNGNYEQYYDLDIVNTLVYLNA